METLKVGICEFRENLANYLLQSDKPLAITRHGDPSAIIFPPGGSAQKRSGPH
jgi:PHD/YefM family antitoxin component YafN of YafNO toxin-antitoxin module